MNKNLTRLMVLAISGLMSGASMAADPAPVKIGVLNDQTSIYAAGGGRGSVEAARLAIEDAGPVLGSQVELVSADHLNKPDVGSAIARSWFEREGVDMITDVPNSAVAFAVQDLARQYRKLLLMTGSFSSDFTGPRCNAYSAAWVTDDYTQANVVGSVIVKNGGKNWFFIAADNAGGRSLVHVTTSLVEAHGGKVLGSAYPPLNNADFSAFLLRAQGSGASVIGLANGGSDTANALKQASEFGMQGSGKTFVAFTMFINDVKSLGLPTAQGLQLATPFYWDLNDQTRAFSARFKARVGADPSWDQAGVYSAVNHYLNAVRAAGTKEPEKVMARMRDMPINDFMSNNATLRLDGRVVRDIHLFQVKKPAESTGEWDLYKWTTTVPGKDAFRPLPDGKCPLVTATAQ